MNPAQQLTLRRWECRVEEWREEVESLLRRASSFARRVVAANETDPDRLNAALAGLEQEVSAVSRRVGYGWGTAREGIYARLLQAGPEFPARARGDQITRDTQVWIAQEWARFSTRWRMKQVTTMWTHVRAAMQKAPPCSLCGVSLRPSAPHKPENARCSMCGAITALEPPPIVRIYCATAPGVIAASQTVEHRLAILEERNDWKNRHVADLVAHGAWPRETLPELRHWESLELGYWWAFAKAKAGVDGSSEAEQRALVEAGMRHFYEEMAEKPEWRTDDALAPTDDSPTVLEADEPTLVVVDNGDVFAEHPPSSQRPFEATL